MKKEINRTVPFFLNIKGLRLKGFHGIEGIEQEFIFDISLYFSFPIDDNLDKTIDYVEVIKEVERINKEPCNLIETLGIRIKKTLCSKFKPEKIFVSVKKPNPPISYSLEYVGVDLKE
ncbi:MAG: dihydroneopterin aldolase [bacterium]